MSSILVISPISSHPPQNGARRRIHNLLSALKADGHEIHFVYTCCENVDLAATSDRLRAAWDSVDIFETGTSFVKSLGADYGVDDWINDSLMEEIGGLAEKYGATHCLTNYVFQSKYLDHLPHGVMRIIDTHDKLSRRHVFEQMGIAPGFFYTTEEEEMRALKRADVVLAIQDAEVDYFTPSGTPIVVVGHLARTASVERRTTDLTVIGYIGANNKFNQHALEAFLPLFLQYSSKLAAPIRIRIAGKICQHFYGKPQFMSDLISFEGFIDDINAFVTEIDLCINPTLLGTGLKIKSVEAMSYGLPIVSTDVGWEGLLGLAGSHDAKGIEDLIEAIDRVRKSGFEMLTKLSNFSKATFAEYQLNLNENVVNLFRLPPEEAIAWASRHPHYIGVRRDSNPDFVTLEHVQPKSSPTERIKLAHIVNPVRMPLTSDLYIAQPITFASMQRAKLASKLTEVRLVAKRFPEDDGYLDHYFDQTEQLTRSAQDIPAFRSGRKLPFLKEMFSLTNLPDDVTHIIYTNSDIGLQPHFYDFVAERISNGVDALVVNRRTVSKRYALASELSEILSELGEAHPGFDCFVASRAVLQRCQFEDTLVGVHLIGRIAIWNLLAYAEKLELLDASHLTFHIGDDVPSKARTGLPYIKHNLLQGAAIARSFQNIPNHLHDQERSDRFDRALSVSPGSIEGPIDLETEPRRRIQMHSFFRTGSTYIYQKVRRQKDWSCYYEPFHEDLAIFNPSKLDSLKEKHAEGRFRHADSGGQWLFHEYESLLDPGAPGVRSFDRRMSYLFEFDGADERIRDYVDVLTASGKTENVFLQFNRTALRQSRMRSLFPDDSHIYLSRGIREIWGSYLSFRGDAVYGFLRNNLAMLTLNSSMPLMEALGDFVPLAAVEYSEFFQSAINQIFHHYTLEQHYLIHAVFWHAARLEADRTADVVIDLEAVSKNRMVRLETEARLAALQMNVSFRDLEYRTYDTIDLLLSSETMIRIESLAEDVARSALEISGDGRVTSPSSSYFGKPHHAELAFAADRLRLVETDARSAKLMKYRNRFTRNGEQPKNIVMERFYPVAAMEKAGWLRLGFHPVEKYHVWGNGDVAVIRFSLPEDFRDAPTGARIGIRLHAHPLIAARHGEILVYLNGEADTTLRPGADWETHHFDVSTENIGRTNGIIDIAFVSRQMFDGRGLSKRTLSICVSTMSVFYIKDDVVGSE